MNEERQEVLLLRVWLEHGTDGFRARLTSLGPWHREEVDRELTVALGSSPSDVAVAVDAWLRDITAVTDG